MNDQVKKYLDQYPAGIVDLFIRLRQLVLDGAPCDPEEKLWARLPSYYNGDSFVRLIPFKDHINIEAKAILLHKDELNGYKVTPKGMLQLHLGEEIPKEILSVIFAETLRQQAGSADAPNGRGYT